MPRRPQFLIFHDPEPVSDAQVARKLIQFGKPINRQALQRRKNVPNSPAQIPTKHPSAESSDDSLELESVIISHNVFLQAVANGEYSTVREYLLQPDAEVGIQRPRTEDTALHIVLRDRPNSWFLMLQRLAKAEAHFFVRNAAGVTPIALVCQCLRDHNSGVLTGARRLNKKETDFLVQLVRKQFFTAIKAGDFDSVFMLLKTRLIDMGDTDEDGLSPLDCAAANDHAMSGLLSWNVGLSESVTLSNDAQGAELPARLDVLNTLLNMLEIGAASKQSSRPRFFKKITPYEDSVHTFSLWMVVIKAVCVFKDDERFVFDADAFYAQLETLLDYHAKGVDKAFRAAAESLLEAPLKDVMLAYQCFSLQLDAVLKDSTHRCYAFAEEMHRRFSNLASDEYQSASLLDGILTQQGAVSDLRT